jgi:pantothenate kinase
LQDGFHFPKKTLATFPCPETAFRRRGAPFTFDADAFVEIVASLKKCTVTQKDDPKLAVRLPSFDHAVQDPIRDDIYVPSCARVVIIEGNYLLFDECPWNKAVAMFDDKYDASVVVYS